MALTSLDPAASLLHALGQRLGDDGLVHVERLPPRPARTGELTRPLPSWLDDRLDELGYAALWEHQAAAVDLLRDRQHAVVATGTASGKSLCYQVPIAEAVNDPIKPGTAIALFPTKALAQDQLKSFGHLAIPNLVAATYDGDTDPDNRRWARQNANVILTNPEMLHGALLPHHEKWATFFMRLRYVVIDELHVLRGVFGTHVDGSVR